MASLETMQNLQSATSGLGTAVGAAAGALAGNPLAGAAVGAAAERAVRSVLPEYSHVRGSVSGINFVRMGLKPYQITLIKPSDLTSMAISAQYARWGCATKRIEPLNINGYLYNGVGFVKGELDYNGTIPMDKFSKINQIFKNGCTVLGG